MHLRLAGKFLFFNFCRLTHPNCVLTTETELEGLIYLELAAFLYMIIRHILYGTYTTAHILRHMYVSRALLLQQHPFPVSAHILGIPCPTLSPSQAPHSIAPCCHSLTLLVTMISLYCSLLSLSHSPTSSFPTCLFSSTLTLFSLFQGLA